MIKDILLISNSKVSGGNYLSHAMNEIDSIIGHSKKIVSFIPYANPDGMGYEKYFQVIKPTFEERGYKINLISDYPKESIRNAEIIFVGGGNTWHLLKILKDEGLLHEIKEAVNNGIPYIGSSAGSNVAGLMIGNTNDMPAAECYGREALGLVPFNINPHYQDTVKLTAEEKIAVLKIAPQLEIILNHQGETRDDRLREYHALGNNEKIVALREGAMLRITHSHIYLKGTSGAKIFQPSKETLEYSPREEHNLDFLLE